MSEDADLEEYNVNEYLSLILIRRRDQTYTILLVGGGLFKSFNRFPIGIFITLPNVKEKIFSFGVDSNNYDHPLDAREEFVKYCSMLQKWADNDYNVKYMNYALTFPILRRLVELEDLLAQKVFLPQIKTIINLGNIEVLQFLVLDNFLEAFSKEDLITIFNDPSSELKNHLEKALDIEDLHSKIFPIIKKLIDLNISWAQAYFTHYQEKLKNILIKQLYNEEKDDRHRTASYFRYFEEQFENKEYSQVVYGLHMEDVVITNLNRIYETALELYQKEQSSDLGQIVSDTIKDLIALDDKEGVQKIYEKFGDDPYDLGDEIRTYILSKQEQMTTFQGENIPECEAKAIQSFIEGQKNGYRIEVTCSDKFPLFAIDFINYMANLPPQINDDGVLNEKSHVACRVRNNHVEGLYVFFSDMRVCEGCSTESFRVCYDECIYFCVPPSIGVFKELEEFIIFDIRKYLGYRNKGNLGIHLSGTIKFLHNLRRLYIPENISLKMGSNEPIFEKLTRQGAKIYKY